MEVQLEIAKVQELDVVLLCDAQMIIVFQGFNFNTQILYLQNNLMMTACIKIMILTETNLELVKAKAQ